MADPENIELNRAQLAYTAGNASLTAGRQRIEILDQRFVGSGSFRQNEQTYDGVRGRWGDPKRTTLDVSYVWNVRTVNGYRGTGARQEAVGGDNLFALIAQATPIGTLTAFAFLVDQDETEVQAFRLSNQSYGLRLAGTRPLTEDYAVSYTMSWATQSDLHRNPNDYRAEYWLAEAAVSRGPLSAGLGSEILGADEGVPFTSFQTPLAALFRFQGWAGRLAGTPPNGTRDFYATLSGGWKKTGPFDALTLQAIWHRFDSDRLNLHYGEEIDVLASGKLGPAAISARYARYRADQFASDTDRFWLSLEWAL